MKHWISLALCALLAACSATPDVDENDAGVDADSASPADAAHDATTHDDSDVAMDASVDAAHDEDGSSPPDGSTPLDASEPEDSRPIGTVVVAVGMARSEICGNEFDDDDNGMIDDGCYCSVGTERPCWLGPPEARGVGECHDGVQQCQSDGVYASWGECAEQVTVVREILENGRDDDCDNMLDELDGVCAPSVTEESGTRCNNGRDDDCDTLRDCDDPSCEGASGCPAGCESSETLCYGGVDDDCDGAFDCADSNCSGDSSCHLGTVVGAACGSGLTPTYRERTLGAANGASSILNGDGQPLMVMTCEAGRCASGQVAVVPQGGDLFCVPPPVSTAACPAGTFLTWDGRWTCEAPCELVIHYGSIYGGLNVCAGYPNIACGGGQTPTFVFETERWECRPTCSNTLYDRVTLRGATVCIPC